MTMHVGQMSAARVLLSPALQWHATQRLNKGSSLTSATVLLPVNACTTGVHTECIPPHNPPLALAGLLRHCSAITRAAMPMNKVSPPPTHLLSHSPHIHCTSRCMPAKKSATNCQHHRPLCCLCMRVNAAGEDTTVLADDSRGALQKTLGPFVYSLRNIPDKVRDVNERRRSASMAIANAASGVCHHYQPQTSRQPRTEQPRCRYHVVRKRAPL